MSDKTPHQLGTDGKPGVSFGPKSLPETEGRKPVTMGVGENGFSIPRLDTAARNQSGQALTVSGRSTKQVSRVGGKPSQPEKPQQGGRKPAVEAKVASQTLPGPVGEKRSSAANPRRPNQPEQSNQPNQRTPRPIPQQVRAALPGIQPGKPMNAREAAGATARVAATGATKVVGDTARATPWAATPTTGKPGKTAKDKFHKPEGTLSKVRETRRTHKARLRISRVDPWSVMKTTFPFSTAFGIMLVVVVAMLQAIVAGSGALQSINSAVTQLLGNSGSQFDVEDYINTGRVIGFVAVLAVLGIVIITAVSTLFAFLYNLAAAVIDGLEVALVED